jgi:O-antigen ligase
MMTDLLTFGVVLFAILMRGCNRPWAIALFSAFAILILAGIVIRDIWRGRLQLRTPWVFLPLLAFIAFVGLQYFGPRVDLNSPHGFLPHTVEPYSTALYLLVAIGCVAVTFSIVHGFRSREQVLRLVICIIAVGVFEACYGLVQKLGGFQYIWGTRIGDNYAHGTILNHNHYALLLNMAISVGVGYLYMRTIELLRGQKTTLRAILAMPDSPKLVWILVLLAIMGLGVFASLSRMGIFAMFVCLGFMVTAVCLTEGKKQAVVLMVFVAIAITGLGLYMGVDAAFERYAELAAPGQIETGRASLWRDAWPMITQTPWFGKGLGSFQWTFRAYETEIPDIPAAYAHNDYLQILAETGIVGLCLVIWVFAACWQTARRNLADPDPMVRGIGLALIGALAAAAVQEITDYSLYIPGIVAPFFLLIGLNERARRLKQSK